MKLSLALIALAGFSTAAAAAGLSNADLAGKRLLDANGAPIGQIVGVTDHGDKAVIQTPDGKRITMDTSRLSQGNGQNTIIATGGSQADVLNHMDRKAPLADGE